MGIEMTKDLEQIDPKTLIGILAMGPLLSQACYVAAKLGIADLLAEGPLSVGQLAIRTGSNEGALYRILRALVSIGMFREVESKVFELTERADPLRSNVSGSFRNYLIFMGENWHCGVWCNMLYSVRTGKPAWEYTHGAEIFDYFTANPDQATIFNSVMTDMSIIAASEIIEAYDFSQFSKIADIGGGHGLLLAQVLKANPTAKGVLFDTPSVIADADTTLKSEGVANRIEKVSGDFFRAVPSGADAYIMKYIVHDWADESCIAILQNINAAMPVHGKLLIMEGVVPDTDEWHPSKISDLLMLVVTGGMDRTEEEYKQLLSRAGFRLTRILVTSTGLCIIEAEKLS
uniref:Hydroxyneurosporene-O-methyltransferase n=1 Tax=Candidatus Kentrum sp. FW TaxID=2126338 RepID=A0A450SEZ6_9GAMM|nr:MAG: hydroxyneurosporene-O-methyltransferase [Candidatus Kentron sp. FW]VFJ66043.1 MAG: hydroxyneurosporene-O-methyltransferase [Candidatus Kentron sp. FW]